MEKKSTVINDFLQLSPAIERLISAYPLLKPEDEQRLTRERSDGARDLLVLSNLRLVKAIVNTFKGCGIEPDDLFSEGMKGLVKAAKKYIPDKGKFTTYAHHSVRGEIMDYIDKYRTLTHVPKTLRKEVNLFRRALEKLGGATTDASIAEKIGCSLEKIRSLRICSEQSTYALGVSLIDVDADGMQRGEDITVLETLWVDDVGYADVERSADLATLLSHLPPLEAEVLRLRWGIDETEPLSLRAVAARLGKGRTWVGDTEKSALNKLRKIVKKEKTDTSDF